MLPVFEYPDAEKVMVADRVFEKPADMLLVVHEIQHLTSAPWPRDIPISRRGRGGRFLSRRQVLTSAFDEFVA